jgi:hypothetical protein
MASSVLNKSIGQTSRQLPGFIKSVDGQTVRGANIVLISGNKEIARAVSDSTGEFTMRYNQEDSIWLVITHASFKPYRQYLPDVERKAMQVVLETGNVSLQEVLVQSKQPQIEVQGGNIVFNVAANLNAQGVDALEVLKKTPGVFVENESVISLNGKQGPLILIDGRQTYLSGRELADLLRSMPSSSIKSIEIISSPTAKYDAVGTAGIINIKTNKSLILGLSGAFTVGSTIGVTLKQNTDVSINFRRGKWNLFGSYNHFIGNYSYLYGSDRFQNMKSFSSFTDDTDRRNRMSTRIGADVTIDKRNTIGVLASGNFVLGGGTTRTSTSIGNVNAPADQFLYAENDYYYQKTERYNFNLNYRFDNGKGYILNVDGDYGSFLKGNKNRQTNIYSDEDHVPFAENFYNSINGIDIDLRAAKVDYVMPLWEGQLEAGVKYSSIKSNNSAKFFYVLSHADSLDERRTNDFLFQEEISSAYLSFNRKFTKWTIQAGVRMENTQSNGELNFSVDGKDTVQGIRRSYNNLFPSIAVTHKPGEKTNLSINYSRRIDRPAYQDLNPFIYLLDELSFWQGNPFLLPQYSHRLSFQYVYKTSTIASLSYIHTNNFSARITDTLQTSSIVMVPRNLGSQRVFTLALTQSFSLAKWWDVVGNGNVSYASNNISFDEWRAMELHQVAGRVSLSQTVRLPKAFTIEVASYYNSRRLSGGNEVVKGNSQVDISVQKAFWERKGLLRLSFIDIYKGNRINSSQRFDGFYMRSHAYYESRQIRLNFTYKFANSSAKAPRTRSSALENEYNRIR